MDPNTFKKINIQLYSQNLIEIILLIMIKIIHLANVHIKLISIDQTVGLVNL